MYTFGVTSLIVQEKCFRLNPPTFEELNANYKDFFFDHSKPASGRGFNSVFE